MCSHNFMVHLQLFIWEQEWPGGTQPFDLIWLFREAMHASGYLCVFSGQAARLEGESLSKLVPLALLLGSGVRRDSEPL